MEEKLKEVKKCIVLTDKLIECNPQLEIEEKHKIKAITYDKIKTILEREDE